MRAAAPTQPVPVGAVRAPSCSKSDSLALQHARIAGDWLELLRALVLALEVPHRIILGEPPKRMCLGEAVQAYKPGLSAHLPHPVKMLGAQEARRAMPARSECSSSPPRATARWSRYGKMRARSSRPLMARWCPSPPMRAPRSLAQSSMRHGSELQHALTGALAGQGGSERRLVALPSAATSEDAEAGAGAAWPARRVVFLNDVYFCARDVVRLLQHDADVACGLDFDRPTLEQAPLQAGLPRAPRSARCPARSARRRAAHIG